MSHSRKSAILFCTLGAMILPSGTAKAQSSASKRSFCNALQASFQQFVSQNSKLEPGVVTRKSRQATSQVVRQLRDQKWSEYFDGSTLLGQQVHPEDKLWLSTSDLLVHAMGATPQRVLAISDVNDLKMIPHTMPGSQVLIVASSPGELTPQRAAAVIDAAKKSQISMYVVWAGSAQKTSQHFQRDVLSPLATQTGGAFVDLNQASKTCPKA